MLSRAESLLVAIGATRTGRGRAVHAGELVGALGWTGAFLGIVLNVPQTWRSCAGRQVAGLSPASRWLAVLQAATWTTYGLTGGGLVQVVTNGVCSILHVAVLLALLRLTRRPAPRGCSCRREARASPGSCSWPGR